MDGTAQSQAQTRISEIQLELDQLKAEVDSGTIGVTGAVTRAFDISTKAMELGKFLMQNVG